MKTIAMIVTLFFFLSPTIWAASKSKPTANKNKENKKVKKMADTYWKIKVKDGNIVIKLRPDLAPKHVERIQALTKKDFYNGLKFHRVIDGFMAQTGDPKGNGSGGSDLPNLPAEFSDAPFKRGIVGMARASSPHSANSQFFIMLADAPHLNGAYTVIGEVESGMEAVDKIKKGDPRQNGLVNDPDKMIDVSLGK